MKRAFLIAGPALFLGALTAGLGFAISPQFLGAAGPVLCEPGRTFLVASGPAQPVVQPYDSAARMRLECVSQAGVSSAAHVWRALFMLVALAASGWALALWILIRRRGSPARRPEADSQTA